MRRGNASAFSAALRDVRRAVDELGRLPRRLAVMVAPQITAEIRQQFVRGCDPYGRPWAPLKPSTLRQHGPPPLTATGLLKSVTRAAPMISGRIGLMLTVGARYGAFHQVGFRVGKTKVPARKILPSRGLPREWREILRRSARALANRATSGVR